jgi:hypothetical protein
MGRKVCGAGGEASLVLAAIGVERPVINMAKANSRVGRVLVLFMVVYTSWILRFFLLQLGLGVLQFCVHAIGNRSNCTLDAEER